MLKDILELVNGVAGTELARVGVHCEGHVEISSAGSVLGPVQERGTR